MSAGSDLAFVTRLREWSAQGTVRAVDFALTRFIHRTAPEPDARVLLAVALTSARHGHGHVALDLAEALAQPEQLFVNALEPAPASAGADADELRALFDGLTLSDWVAALRGSQAVQAAPANTGDTGDMPPLVLGGTPARPLLYLRRCWTDETRIRAGIAARLTPLALPPARLRPLLAALFDPPAAGGADWQQLACALAARMPFAIVTGGPGTGKTTAVVRLLAVLQGLARQAGGQALRIRLAAPTGKAAARLNASIAGRVAALPWDRLPDGERLRPLIPTEVTTLHRLLGAIPDSRRFRHHAGHPLAADLVVVDEASMMDVEMMARLLEALPPEARLILLGDRDQLASVEAGAVLGDLCRRARSGHYTPETHDWLTQASGAALDPALVSAAGQPLDQAIVMLRFSHRFDATGGIGALAAAVNAEDGNDDPDARLRAVLALLPAAPVAAQTRGVRFGHPAAPRFARFIAAGYGPYLKAACLPAPDDATAEQLADWARGILALHQRFQLLTPLRQGDWGVTGLNQRILELLHADGLLPGLPGRQWFAGRPVLVTRNDYSLKLMNGDVGVTLDVPVLRADGRGRGLRVAMPAGDGSGRIRWLLPSRLQAIETVFAMTVHKAQGSEFDHAALILPSVPNPVLTRELLYTGITRARERFTLLYARESVLRQALERRVRRVSGLGGEEDPIG